MKTALIIAFLPIMLIALAVLGRVYGKKNDKTPDNAGKPDDSETRDKE